MHFYFVEIPAQSDSDIRTHANRLSAQVAAYNCVSRFLVALDGELSGEFLCTGKLLICWQSERRTASSLEAPIRSDISHFNRMLYGPRLLCIMPSHNLQILRGIDSSLPCHCGLRDLERKDDEATVQFRT